MTRATWIFAGVVLLALEGGPAAAAVSPAIAAAVNEASRPDADKQRDAERMPAETLAFSGVKPDDSVAELIPGGGYFTRLLSKVVGGKGHVYAVAPARRPDAPADTPDRSVGAKRVAADAHYANVSVLVEPIKSVSVPAPVDLIWTSQNYHDVHNVPNIDLLAFNKSVFDALKPGGVYLVIDHMAQPGSGARDTSTLHRIDSQLVKTEVLAAGFVLDSQSDLLHRATDPQTAPVFDASIRGKTDQFLLKFRKPKKNP